jgi:beta-N-acetylhexosaminidase
VALKTVCYIHLRGACIEESMPATNILRKLMPWALALLLIMTPSSRAQKKSSAQPAPGEATKTASNGSGDSAAASAPANSWAAQTLRQMTLRKKIGQMLMVPYYGEYVSTEGAEYKDLLHQIDDNHVGGLIIGTDTGPLGLQRSEVYPTAVVTNELQRRSKVPLLVGADFENGTRMRLDEGTSFPSAMAIGATGDPKFAYTAGKYVALEARAAGVHWIFAPDADVNDNPENPIINTRSFGENPQDVARYVTQYIRGIQQNGALATAKHFPGHGNVSVDSHLALSSVPGSRAELENTELVPFRAAIAAGVSSIMPGHLSVPALDPDAGTPATLSRPMLTDLLRGEMKYRGLIITDAMEMGGLTTLYSPGEAAVRAVEAGEDVLLMPPVPDAAVAAIEQAVRSGRISEKRIDESVLRILAAKARLGLNTNRTVDLERLNRSFAQPAYEAQALAIADRGVTLLRDTDHVLPLNPAQPLRVLLVSLSADADPYPGETIEPELRKQVDSLRALRADTKYSTVENLKLPPPATYDVAIAAVFVRVTDGKGNVGMPVEQRNLVNQLIAAGKPTVVAGFGSPYLIGYFPNAKTWLAEFASSDVAQRAAVRAMLGQITITGKIPVTVPGTAKRGDGLTLAANPMTLQPAPASLNARLKPAYDLLDRAVADDAFPGGVLSVGLHGQLATHAFGKLTRDAKAAPVTASTIYDVASLTKPIATTTEAMVLVQQKRLDLDIPIIRFLPEWAAGSKSDPDPGWRARVTTRMLLLHDSGLPAHRDFFLKAKSRDAMLKMVMAEPLVREPGKQVEYSDLGFILLGEILDRLTGKTEDQFAQQQIFAPLEMKSSLFNPPKDLRAQIAPTENDAAFRKRLLQGEVHDENAWAMGGVAGHAGLFSTAPDIAAFAQMLLNGGIYAHNRLLSRATIQTFTARQAIGDSARTLGWDVPSQPSSSGRYFSAAAYGHTGFTGTSLWIDPQRQVFVILLTNRVNPTRENEKIRQVRPALHDAIFEALGLASPSGQ